MSKTVKNSLIVIAIVAILFGIAWFGYDMLKKEPVMTETNANLADGNTGLDNIINDLLDNQIENEIVENVTEDKENVVSEEETDEGEEEEKKDNKNQVNDKNTVTNGSTTESVTSREEKAITLVKKEWGNIDGVYFSNESVDSKGRYIVSVRDKKTTASLAFYVVDVDKKLVAEQ